MSRPHATAAERLRQAVRLLRSEGPAAVAGRLRRRAAAALVPDGTAPLLVDTADFTALAAAPDDATLDAPALWEPGRPLRMAWVCVPMTGGSGGHTTMFRMVAAMESAGHECVVYLRERHGWDLDQHRRTIHEWWPWVRAEIRDVAEGIEDCDAIVATGWDTAYTVKASPARGVRFYLVQDFEPSFYAAGSASLMAEATYSFGFHGITAGPWLAAKLAREFGMECDSFDFGTDLVNYGAGASLPATPPERTSICYYSRPWSPRRAHELAVFALELFAARHPEVDIHVYGEPAPGLSFPVTEHGTLTPSELGVLYRRCTAGLVLSATNVSLVPYEMLAAGCTPVVNEAEHNRMVLANEEVAYAAASPVALSAALCALVEEPSSEREERSRRASRSVQDSSWDDAGKQVESAMLTRVEKAWAHARSGT